jgi:hypothetical protein
VSDQLKSIVRTFVPVVVGLILSGLATIGVEVPEGALTTVVDALFVGGYYALVRVLEEKNPSFGWLLGLPTPPNYERTTKSTEESPPLT